VHNPCGPLPFKNTARTLDLSSRSRSPSLPQASLIRDVIESRPLTHLTLHPFWVARDIGDSRYEVHERHGARVDKGWQREERDLRCGDAHYGDGSGIDLVVEFEMGSEGSGGV
jgi:hypothetical protein